MGNTSRGACKLLSQKLEFLVNPLGKERSWHLGRKIQSKIWGLLGTSAPFLGAEVSSICVCFVILKTAHTVVFWYYELSHN